VTGKVEDQAQRVWDSEMTNQRLRLARH